MNIKNQIQKLCLLIVSVLLISSSAPPNGSKQATLRGVIIDRPQSTLLLLVKQGEDFRINAIQIPIIDGKFEYVFDFEYEEQYELVFDDEQRQGAWRPVPFFMEQGVINFILYSTDVFNREACRFNENMVEGGEFNNAFQSFIVESRNKIQPLYDILNVGNARLREDNKYYTLEAQSLLDRIDKSDNDEERSALFDKFHRLRFESSHITQAAKMLEDSIHQEVNRVRIQHIKENLNLVGYSALLSEVSNLIQRNRFDGTAINISPHADLYRTFFASQFPDHPYTERMENMLVGSSINPGVSFVDFTAVDLNGNSVKLSEKIAGKPAVLNLWASWCGPCRRKGKELIPVYEVFRDKGFVVIGVARETSISHAEAAIKMDGYPWENFVELNDVEQIWTKYGIGNSGGSIFLIDENGIIVASNPTVEEITEFLEKRGSE
jgi:thiol-disulfide isomerase/thioredoxin